MSILILLFAAAALYMAECVNTAIICLCIAFIFLALPTPRNRR